MGPPPRGVFGTPPSLFPALNKDGDDSGSGKAAFFLGPGPCQRHAFHPPGGDRAPNSPEDVREDMEDYITYILHSSIYLKRQIRAIFYISERS